MRETAAHPPAAHYRSRFEALAAQQKRTARNASMYTVALAADLAMTGVLARQAWLGKLPVYPAGAFTFVAALLVSRLLHLRFTRMYRLHRLTESLEAALGRATGETTQSGLSGEEFCEPGHVYERDLDILGNRDHQGTSQGSEQASYPASSSASVSLFGLLATVRTHLAQRRLAQTLLHPPPPETIVARQRAIQLLAPRTKLRERIALLGSSPIHQIPAGLFEAWLDEPPITAPSMTALRATRPVLLVTALTIVTLAALGLAHVVSWTTLGPNLAAILAIQGAIALYLRPRILSPMKRASRLAQPAMLLREALSLLIAEDFSKTHGNTAGQGEPGPILQALKPHPEALKSLSRLQTQLTLLEQRTKEWFYAPCLLFSVGIRATLALEDWKRRHGDDLRRWLAAWAEFETLNALATFAFEHSASGSDEEAFSDESAYTYPEILSAHEPATFEASHLSHPLLPASAVTNDIALGGTEGLASRFYLISGSNMAGKSTLLRSVGVNAVLAAVGAPIRAASARISPLTIGASLALTDSLADGRSKFLAEVERLSQIVAIARSGQPVLFLIDEIFSGTNSHDRRSAAEAILRQLIAHQAIGALSTHDLTLTDLAKTEETETDRARANRRSTDPSTAVATPPEATTQIAKYGLNLHMASPDPDDPLAFDYRLKPGVNTSSNAQAILRMMHLED